MMELTFLGTGTSQGVPIIGCRCPVCTSSNHKDQRLRTSAFIQSGDTRVVIDVGPDFRQQILREGISQVDGILVTHEHNDHVAGLDDVRPFNYMQGHPMPIWASDQVLKEIRTRFGYAFDENPYPGAPKFNLQAISSQHSFSIGSLHIVPIEVDHGGLPVLGFRFNDLVYITDAKRISAAQRKKIEGARILILNVLREKPHNSHFHLEEAIQFVRDCGVERAWFTHISHELGLYNDVSTRLPDGMALAYDGLRIRLED